MLRRHRTHVVFATARGVVGLSACTLRFEQRATPAENSQAATRRPATFETCATDAARRCPPDRSARAPFVSRRRPWFVPRSASDTTGTVWLRSGFDNDRPAARGQSGATTTQRMPPPPRVVAGTRLITCSFSSPPRRRWSSLFVLPLLSSSISFFFLLWVSSFLRLLRNSRTTSSGG